MIDLPKLYFKKVHKSTGAEFINHFTGANLKDWDLFKLCEIHSRAKARIDYWNSMLGSEWVYSIIGWGPIKTVSDKEIWEIASDWFDEESGFEAVVGFARSIEAKIKKDTK